MTAFPIIEVISAVLNLTNHGYNHTNMTDGYLYSANDVAIVQSVHPYPLGHPSPIITGESVETVYPQVKPETAYPYLLNPPVLDKARTQLEEHKEKSSKSVEANDGWNGFDGKNWVKHGSDQASEGQRSKKGEAKHGEAAYKHKKEGDTRDSQEKWKGSSEKGEDEKEGIHEEYDKNKGHVYEKKWSWHKERGWGHGSGEEGHRHEQNHDGVKSSEELSKRHKSLGKEAWAKEEAKRHDDKDDWGRKHLDEGTVLTDQESHGINVHGLDHWDTQYLHQLGLL